MPGKKTYSTTEKAPRSALQKALTIVGLVLCAILLPILVINVTLIIKGYLNKDAVPSIGGRFPLIVLTDSMYPEIESGDLIFCKTADPESVEVGDIISFFDPDGNGSSIVTHRVIEITQTDEGELAFVTKGDFNNTADKKPAPASKLVGVYQGRVHGLGKVAMFMQTTAGLIVCVVLPLLLLVGIDLLRTRRYERAHKENTDELMRELEELRAIRNASKTPDTKGATADPGDSPDTPPSASS